MTTLIDIVAAALVLTGAGIALVAAIGLHRLPDLYARMHSATKPATLGISLCLSGAMLRVDHVGDVTKIVLAIAMQLLTNPVGAHLLGRAAHGAGAPQAPSTVIDELDGQHPA